MRGARIVLVDDTGVRARMSAAWLRQMGHREVFVAERIGSETGVAGACPTSLEVPTISAETLAHDARPALQSSTSHAASISVRAISARSGACAAGSRRLGKLASARRIVLTSPDGVMARFARGEGHDQGGGPVLDGGTAAWRAAGQPVVADRTNPPDDACIDFYLRAYDRNSGVEEAMNAYLTWEIDLVNEIERDGTVVFGLPGETHADLIWRAVCWALDLVLPPRCAVCDNPVDAHGQLCAVCFGRTQFISVPFCPRCGVPFAATGQGGTEGLCPGCRTHPPLFREARAALRYDEQARRLILPLKHSDRIELASVLAPMMVRAGAGLLRRADLLVPVPLHRRRLLHRKYNQAALLALAIGKLAGRPVLPDALIREPPDHPIG